MNGVADKTALEIRIEPWLISVIYVYIQNEWHAAVAANSRVTDLRTTKEEAITTRARDRLVDQMHSQGLTSPHFLSRKATYADAALWDPRTTTAEVVDPILAAKQQEMRYLFSRNNLGLALPHAIDETRRYLGSRANTFEPVEATVIEMHGSTTSQSANPANISHLQSISHESDDDDFAGLVSTMR